MYTCLHLRSAAWSVEAVFFFGFLYVSSTQVAWTIIHIQQVLGVIAYRLTLHPLAKYPGPLLGRITDWYSVIRSAAGDRHIHFLELHHKHGKVLDYKCLFTKC